MVLILGLVSGGYGRRRYDGMLRGTVGRGRVELLGLCGVVYLGGCREAVEGVAAGSLVGPVGLEGRVYDLGIWEV